MSSVCYEDGGCTSFDIERFTASTEFLAKGLDISARELHDALKILEKSLTASITVDQLLELGAESLAQRIISNPDFSLLAGRMEVKRVSRSVKSSFSENFKGLRAHQCHHKAGLRHLVTEQAANFVQLHSDYLDALICPERDSCFTYFGIKTLIKSYFLRIGDSVVETPQYLFLRVAIGLHGDVHDESSLNRVQETYTLMSEKYFIFSSPTLFNAGTENGCLSLCFLMGIQDDSIDGIFKSLHSAALILKGSGGLGIHVHNVRGRGSIILSSNGSSSGLIAMLRVFNNTARYVGQGNNRPGAFAIYIEPWHCDIMEVLDIRKNHGPEELRARDLFLGLWIPDLFMKRVKTDGEWCLVCPSEVPGLSDVYGDEFERLYEEYEAKGMFRTKMKARKLWMRILEAQTETGLPYMLYKDSCNRKLNQQNLGTIKSSNLCCEIVEYSSPSEVAVCNLGLLCLPSFVRELAGGHRTYDFAKLHEVTKVLARNLNRVIDVTKYPVEAAKNSNLKHRPIAIGVQGLADTFLELRLPFDSAEAGRLNSQIFETIYHGAIESSIELAMELLSYESFAGSPASKGNLQFDLWGHTPEFFNDWDEIKERVKKHGLRNSLLVGPMPTASTSQIMGFNECFEPFTSNIYTRRVLSGEYQVVNKYLVKDLMGLGIWSSHMKDKILMDNGLIQHIDIIPHELKALYKTVWEISQKDIVRLALGRGRFIDQLQSMNIHLSKPTFGSLTSCHFYAWEQGLKTGMYYLRTQAATRAIPFTVDTEAMYSELSRLQTKNLRHLKRTTYLPQYNMPDILAKSKPNDQEKRRRKDVFELKGEDFVKSTFAMQAEDNRKISTEQEKVTDDVYDIYDNTPLNCETGEIANCEACSG